MGNISLCKIWISGFGGDAIQRDFLSTALVALLLGEAKPGRRHCEGHFCEIILNLD